MMMMMMMMLLLLLLLVVVVVVVVFVGCVWGVRCVNATEIREMREILRCQGRHRNDPSVTVSVPEETLLRATRRYFLNPTLNHLKPK